MGKPAEAKAKAKVSAPKLSFADEEEEGADDKSEEQRTWRILHRGGPHASVQRSGCG